MTLTRSLAALAALATLAAGPGLAQDDTPEQAAHEARSQHMNVYAFHIGKLGAMAQGGMEYDAATATAAADALVALSGFDHALYWIPGSAVGEVEDSRALPAIWENYEDFETKQAALNEAATAMQAAAGTDLAGLQGAMGALGGACGSCHETYRQPDD